MPVVHPTNHLLLAAALLIGAVACIVIARNRVIRRRLLFSAVAAVVVAVVHVAAVLRPDGWLLSQHGWRLEQLIAAGVEAHVVDRPGEEDDAFFEQARVDVVGAFASISLLDDHGD